MVSKKTVVEVTFWTVFFLFAFVVGSQACDSTAKSMPTSKWLNRSGVVNASNYTIRPMAERFYQYSAVGQGYASKMQGWASWGVSCDKRTGSTMVAVWLIPLSKLRCVRNTRWQTPYFSPVDYSGECV
jgi:hypothetical protein